MPDDFPVARPRAGFYFRGHCVEKKTRAMNKLLVTVLLIAVQSAEADTLSGRVVGVADGDTLTVLDGNNKPHKIRLSGIDAPEKSQAYGQRSKQSLSALAYSRSVSVEWRKRDRYRRIVGKVFECGRDLNLEQVRRGLAWHYKQYQGEQDASDRARYATAETEARAAQRGLWALPVPPWEWRHGGKQSAQAAGGRVALSGCGSKRYCGEMVSCEEAAITYRRAGLPGLDGDSDGVPCEALCR